METVFHKVYLINQNFKIFYLVFQLYFTILIKNCGLKIIRTTISTLRENIHRLAIVKITTLHQILIDKRR